MSQHVSMRTLVICNFNEISNHWCVRVKRWGNKVTKREKRAQTRSKIPKRVNATPLSRPTWDVFNDRLIAQDVLVFEERGWNNATIQVTNVQNIIYEKFIQAEVGDIIHIFTVEQHSFRFNIWWQPIHFSSQLYFSLRFDACFSFEHLFFVRAEILALLILQTRKVFGLKHLATRNLRAKGN